jgi:hypothetical protein
MKVQIYTFRADFDGFGAKNLPKISQKSDVLLGKNSPSFG